MTQTTEEEKIQEQAMAIKQRMERNWGETRDALYHQTRGGRIVWDVTLSGWMKRVPEDVANRMYNQQKGYEEWLQEQYDQRRISAATDC